MSCLSAALLLIVVWQWGNAGWIFAKAQLAQWLIAQAWEETLEQGREEGLGHAKPWPWADTHPVARLRMESEAIDLFILEGAQGNSLAFGPGHMQGTALPGEGVSVIGGHRDTHFRFLQNVARGDKLQLETRDGRRLSYQIEQIDIVDSRHTPLILEESDIPVLVLITCYPFDAINPNGPLRFVVRARMLDTRSDSGFANFMVRHEEASPSVFSL